MILALLKFKQENPLISEWTNDKFFNFLYDKFPPTTQFWEGSTGGEREAVAAMPRRWVHLCWVERDWGYAPVYGLGGFQGQIPRTSWL